MTMDPNEHSEEHFELFDKMLENRLSQPEAGRLEELLSSDAEARRVYLEYADQHAALYWEEVSPDAGQNRELVALAGADGPGPVRSKILWLRPAMAAAACVALLAAGFYGGRQKVASIGGEAPVVATLVKTKGCAWGGGTLPTERGARLTKGRMNLVSGLATLRFESGAEVVLEAPAEIELVDPMRCILHDGTLTAQVPPEAQGFVVDTASAHLVDHGTEFGVFVDAVKGTTDVQVFDGIVDVEQRTTREQQRMFAGQRSTVDDSVFDVREAANYESGPGARQPGAKGFERGAVAITTADGVGRDGYVQSVGTDTHVSETLLLVKNAEGEKGYLRKTYLAFDLGALGGKTAGKARVQLQIERSGWGYASSVPDAGFAVYGVSDEGLDGWDAETLEWENAPANLPGGAELDTAKTTLLGRFEIPQGQYSGFAGIEGDALEKFLDADSNGVATFIIVRETPERRGGGLVHAFSGSNHPGGVAPTLLVIPD